MNRISAQVAPSSRAYGRKPAPVALAYTFLAVRSGADGRSSNGE
ncbi:hypothetical protein Q7O44_14460 [Shigella flexneri]|nr:hypothetical protein [Shigella flexneri]